MGSAVKKNGYEIVPPSSSPQSSGGYEVVPPEQAAVGGGNITAPSMPNAGLASPGKAPQIDLQEVTTPESMSDAAWKGVVKGGYAIPNTIESAITALDSPTSKAPRQGDFLNRQKQMYADTGKAIIGGVKQLNPLPSDVGQGLPNRISEGAGTLAGGAMVGGALSDAVPEPVQKATRQVPTKASLAETITDKINPHPDERPAFQQNVEQHLDSALNEYGKPITNRADLGTAFKARAVAAKKDYDTLVKPVQDERVSTTAIPGYSGATIGEGRNTATLSQLEKRLGIINNTLNATYEKGGLAAQSALGAEAKVALTSEAQAIRSTINTETAARLRIKPEDVAAARQAYGATGNVADKIQWYLDNEKYSANKVANQPAQAPDISAIGAANMARKAVWDKIAGNPADKAVRNAFQGYNPSPNNPLVIGPVKPASPPRSPAWLNGNGQNSGIPDIVQGATQVDSGLPAFLQDAISPKVNRTRPKSFATPEISLNGSGTGSQADALMSAINEKGAALLPQVGHIVESGGKRVRVTKVHPDGSFDGEALR